MNVAQAILDSLQKQGNKVICHDSQVDLTAKDVMEACRSAANYYQAAVTGPRVGILLPICASYPAAAVGAMWAGKVPVLLNPLLKPAELEFILQEGGIDTVVTAGQLEASLTGFT